MILTSKRSSSLFWIIIISASGRQHSCSDIRGDFANFNNTVKWPCLELFFKTHKVPAARVCGDGESEYNHLALQSNIFF